MKIFNKTTKRKIKQQNFTRQILQAAESLFAEKGFYPTKVDEIARKAKLAKGTIYLRFKNKRDLFLSLIERKLELMLQEISQKARGNKPFQEKMEDILETHLRFLEENKDFFRIMQGLQERVKKEMHRRLKKGIMEKHSEYLKIVEGVLRQGIKEGKVKPLDVKKLPVILVGMIHSITIQWIMEGEKGSLVKNKPLLWEIFWRGVAKDG